MPFSRNDILTFIILSIFFGRFGIFIFILYWIWKTYKDDIKAYWKYGKIINVSPSNPDNPKVPKNPSPLSSLHSLFPFNMKFPKLKISIASILILATVLIIVDGFTSIPAGSVGVIYDRGRGVLTESLPEGLHLKIPFWQVIEKMDTRLQAYTMSIDPDEGEHYGDDSIESLTKDGQKVYADITIQYRIDGKDAAWIYQNVGLDYDAKVIRPGIRNVARDIITGYDSTQLFTQESRTAAQGKMKDSLSELYAENKVELQNVLLRNIRFSDVYLQAIEAKQVAQQRIQKAEYERQEAEKVKERKIIEAEAEAEAIRLKGEILKAYPQVIQFEFVQRMADDINWGVLPNDILPLVDLKQFNQ
jgi:regulator of protease activity HflC (stomatin/prohibitin superfamily)